MAQMGGVPHGSAAVGAVLKPFSDCSVHIYRKPFGGQWE